MTTTIDHSKLEAWALCWPNEPTVLLYTTERVAEQDRKWFATNYKKDRDGYPRGEPFVLVLEVKRSGVSL